MQAIELRIESIYNVSKRDFGQCLYVLEMFDSEKTDELKDVRIETKISCGYLIFIIGKE